MSRNTLSPLIKAQVEKLTAAAAGGQRIIIGSSSPIIIPKKAICMNTSSQSSSSYTSIGDQMSSVPETFLQSHQKSNDVYTSLPMLPSTCEKLEHTAARDRILVKNKRLHASRGKLSTLKEKEDNSNDILRSTPDDDDDDDDDEEEFVEKLTTSRSTIDLTDLGNARSRLRVATRPRDHSADNILPKITIAPMHTSNVQRSVSFKRPQEMNETKFLHRSIRKIERNDDVEDKTQKRPTQEHIYDNLDVFKQNKINMKSDLPSTDRDSSADVITNIREHAVPTAARLRPVTMHIPLPNENQTTSEFENVFNQLKKRASIKRIQPKEEVFEEPVQSSLPPAMIEEKPNNLVRENEPIVPLVVSTSKVTVTSLVTQSPNRRRTVGGIHLTGNNKVATEENKPTPSWIDIAKQKQSKFQSVTNEKDPQEEVKQQSTSPEPVMASTKPMSIPSTAPVIKENTVEEPRANRKSMYEPVFTRRASPSITTQVIERDSIRALKVNNPNRINNLIQFFDK